MPSAAQLCFPLARGRDQLILLGFATFATMVFMLRVQMILGALIAVGLSGCDQEVSQTCSGTLIEVPEGGDGSGFTVPQLMAHASAMGMTQQEAETLIYLEGLSPQATLKAGERICLDGRPDA